MIGGQHQRGSRHTSRFDKIGTMSENPPSAEPAPAPAAPPKAPTPASPAETPPAGDEMVGRELRRSDIESTPQVTRNRTLPIVLFVATCLSTFWVGAAKYHPLDTMGNPAAMWAVIQSNWVEGLTYMGAVLAILLTHEMGHFLQTVRHGIPASYPLCIPVPFNPIGTMGAVISMDGMRADRKQIFDIGIAGPLAGLVVAIPILWVGVQQLDLTTDVGPREIQLNSPVIVTWMMEYSHPEWNDKSDWIAISQVNPWFMAGWVGMLIHGTQHASHQPTRRRAYAVRIVRPPRAVLRPRLPRGGHCLRGNQPRTGGHLVAHVDPRDPNGRQSPQNGQRQSRTRRRPLDPRNGIAVDPDSLLSAFGIEAVKLPGRKLHGCFWLLLLGVPAFIGLVVFVGRPRSGTADTAAEAPMHLPPDATDITYYLGNAYPLRCYNFKTSEAAFLEWVASFPILKRVDRTGHGLLTPVLDANGEVRLEPIPESDYILFSWSEEDRGEHAAFDRVEGRAYYYAHTR